MLSLPDKRTTNNKYVIIFPEKVVGYHFLLFLCVKIKANEFYCTK
jgi:hypothetical protein